jgi:hypothetical protein
MSFGGPGDMKRGKRRNRKDEGIILILKGKICTKG